MLRHYQLLAFFSAIILLGSCNSLPDNAKYIPQNAVVVVGIHTNEIGKKIAWNAITGSKLIDELKKRKLAAENSTIDPEQMGIELNSVTYVYMKADNRFENGNRVTALIPLDDVAKWEAFAKKSFPTANIKTQGDRKNAMLANGMYAGWNNKLLVIMNTIYVPQDYDMTKYVTETDDSTDIQITDSVTITEAEPVVDETQLLAEMDNAFGMKKENSLVNNKRFTKLETGGYDITIWVNYDEIMNTYGAKGMSSMMGLSVSNVLWKDAAFAAGIDFEKGKINGDMLYYSPEEMNEVAKEMGKESADKEMIDMLPLANPNMVFTWHLSPKGIRGTLDKMGLLGFVNLALSQQNLSADDVLAAVSGDMAFVVRDFAVTTDTIRQVTYFETEEGRDSVVHGSNYSTDAKFLYVLKIGKKENFNKLLQLAVTSNVIKSMGNNTYALAGDKPVMLVTNDKYLVCANNDVDAKAFLEKTNTEKKNAEIGSTLNHPVGMYVDLQSLLGSFTPANMREQKDAVMLAETKKLLKNITMHGGEYNSGSFKYSASVNFNNKEENALLQLIDFAVRMSEVDNGATTAKITNN